MRSDSACRESFSTSAQSVLSSGLSVPGWSGGALGQAVSKRPARTAKNLGFIGIGAVVFQKAMPNSRQHSSARARHTMYYALRRFLESEGYQEVETPSLVPAPGMEPHIDPFAVQFTARMESGPARLLYLITSPEYAMKRLLADGSGPNFQICKAFRNGEISATHNPEFTLLELYRPREDYRRMMSDLERAWRRSRRNSRPVSSS